MIIVTIKLVIVCINCIFSVSEIDDNDDPSCMSTDDPGSSEARWNHVADIVAGKFTPCTVTNVSSHILCQCIFE